MVRTFHSFGAWFLRVNAAPAGLDRNFLIYDEDDSLALLKASSEEAAAADERERRMRAALYEEISRVKDLGLAAGRAGGGLARGRLLARRLPAYEDAPARPRATWTSAT